MEQAYLLVDFGSTYTKLTLVGLESCSILCTSKSITTIDTSIMNGFNDAYKTIENHISENNIKIIKKLACSSAAGGLKMIAVGLVPELTMEAAKRACLGAGARVLKSYSYELSNKEIKEIENSNCDLILLAGGTDGGNKVSVLHNANLLANGDIKVPIIIACNKTIQEEIDLLFKANNITSFIAENVMPTLNVLNVESVRDVIRDVFISNIVKAKGLDSAVKYIGDVLLPTPAAVLKAGYLLANGTDNIDGIGDLLIVDIGGATTDVHSLADGYPSIGGVTMKGLEEPYSKRTVEGDLGMRYSAVALLEACGVREINKYLTNYQLTSDEVKQSIQFRYDNINFVPETEFDCSFDEAIAKVAIDYSIDRHTGYIETTYSPFGKMFSQMGKDLTGIKYVIGTGGVLVHSSNPCYILESIKFDELKSNILRPRNPNYLLDKTYILSAMGLLAHVDEDLALNIMKKYIINSTKEHHESKK